MITSLKKVIHHFFPPTSYLYFYLWINFYWKPQKNSIEAFLNDFSKEHKSTFFLQIGSNDGFHGDPLYKFIRRDNWQGVLVEPMEELFLALKNNYRKIDKIGHLSFENVAISNEKGSKDFYYVKPFQPSEKLPFFLNQQGSFNPNHLKEVKIKYPEVEIGTRKVSCQTVQNIIEKYRPEKIDLIHIDTEGHDFTILKSIDVEALQPKMVLYEHRHMTEFQQKEIEGFFEAKGYEIKKEIYDTLVFNLSAENVRYFEVKKRAAVLA